MTTLNSQSTASATESSRDDRGSAPGYSIHPEHARQSPDSRVAGLRTTLDAAELNESLRRRYAAGATRSRQWRAHQLEAMVRLIDENAAELEEALYIDLGKPTLEAFVGELSFVRGEASRALKHLKAWMRPERVSTDVFMMPAQSTIVREPLGVVLIIAPWNYPLMLSLAPMVGAIAAGNCMVLKPSEIAPRTSEVLAKMIPRYLDTSAIRIVEGGIAESTALLEQRWDHILYTGNAAIGRVVLAAAAKHLTPVTLELGGKSPCIVDSTAKLSVTARRLAMGKFFNCGQTCVAPDYVLVERSVADELVAELRRVLRAFYGDDAQRSASYARIVNERHFDRVVRLLDGAHVEIGGRTDRASLYIEPTVLTRVEPSDKVMQEEIFGPLLPIVTVSSVDEAVDFVNSREKPLASYIFSRDRGTQDHIIHNTSAGATCVNHVAVQSVISTLPFGGVGESGMGAYHGKFGFETFSHRRAVLRKSTLPELPVLEPPYSDRKLGMLRRLI